MKTKRWFASKEFYETEKVYVHNLELICSLFIDPMKEGGILSDDMEYIMFGNVKALLVVHKRFLQELTSNCYDIDGNDHFEEVSIGRIFKSYIPFLTLYKDYMHCQQHFNIVYTHIMKEKRIRCFLEECLLDPRCNGLNLSSFLIMPIQRIPRYRLLLQEILKHTQPSQPDYTALLNALESLSDIARECDESLDWDDDETILAALRSRLPQNQPLLSSCTILRRVVATLVRPATSNDSVNVFFLTDRLVITDHYSSISSLTVLFSTHFILCSFAIHPQDPSLLQIHSKSLELELRLQTSREAKDLAALSTHTASRLHTLCSLCHRPITPSRCCLCQKCGAIVCEDCGGTIAELERAFEKDGDMETGEEWEETPFVADTFLCRSCFQYARYYAPREWTMEEAIAKGNCRNPDQFLSPQFPSVLMESSDASCHLPTGWEVAQTKEGKLFYFNSVLWLSSWSFPSAEWTNDAPIGYAKYYDANGESFLYDAKKGTIPKKLRKRVFDGKCPCCGYDCTGCRRVACPACNSRLVWRLC